MELIKHNVLGDLGILLYMSYHSFFKREAMEIAKILCIKCSVAKDRRWRNSNFCTETRFFGISQ